MDYWKTSNILSQQHLLDNSIEILEKNLRRRYLSATNSLVKELNTLYDNITSNLFSITHIYNYQRYFDLINKLNTEMNLLGEAEEKLFNTSLTKLYKSNYKLISEQYGFSGMFNEELLKGIVYKDWLGDGSNFSDRIWKDKDRLISFLTQEIFNTMFSGKSTDELTKSIMDEMSVGFSNASRLARTESSHIYNQSALDRYRDAGVKQVEYLAEKNECTCKICKEKNGTRYDVENAPEIVQHPSCRCCWVPAIE